LTEPKPAFASEAGGFLTLAEETVILFFKPLTQAPLRQEDTKHKIAFPPLDLKNPRSTEEIGDHWDERLLSSRAFSLALCSSVRGLL
jgi:hypothetical protein